MYLILEVRIVRIEVERGKARDQIRNLSKDQPTYCQTFSRKINRKKEKIDLQEEEKENRKELNKIMNRNKVFKNFK